jgi:hypothetical protein
MLRTLASIVAGLVTWGVVVTALDFVLRAAIPGYHAAEPTLAFTMPMKIGRLLEAAIASVVAGYVIGAVAPASRYAPWIAGIVLLAVFIPEHIHIGSKLPLWYHLTFLLTLAPLVAAGAQLHPKRARVA